MNKHKTPNRLIHEKSPYLLQHAYNPVNWYAWGGEAFEIAKKQNKPIFLSIGYSTCHWCHVMAHESFENEIIADYLNEHFISIKLDREEYPEIDNIYMHACQMINGSGGWPLTVFMDYSQKPFFVNTYFPPEDRYGRIGFLTLLKRINQIWLNEPDKINLSINSIAESINFNNPKSEQINFSEKTVHSLYNSLLNFFDKNYGGFGNAPKFPTPQNFLFLLDYALFYNSNTALDMVEKSLFNMRLGGIFDQVGFGFHRYSTDKFWLLPHFEKMLYDQAGLLIAYSKTYKITKNIFYKNTAYEIIKFLQQELLSTENAFYSAIDADSENEEGKFYVWSYDELKNIIPNNHFDEFCNYYNIYPDGNYKEESTKEKTGKNILHITNYNAELSKKFAPYLHKLYEIRKTRVHPIIDKKILTDWNSLIIWALSEASIIFEDEDLIKLSESTFNFIKEHLLLENYTLLHRYIDGEAGLDSTADDYAFLIRALLSLFKASHKIEYLEFAIKLNDSFIQKYWDEDNFGFYFSPVDGQKLISRSKQLFDNAIPSANSVAALNLIELYSLTGDNKYYDYFEKILKCYDKNLLNYTRSLSMIINAFAKFNKGYTEVIILENNNPIKAKEFLSYVNKNINTPFTLMYINKNNFEQYIKLNNSLVNYQSYKDDAYIFICKNGNCHLPTNNMDTLSSFFN